MRVLDEAFAGARAELDRDYVAQAKSRLRHRMLGDPLVPRVGRFVLERELGRGGMGVVYCARDPELDRSIAIKLVRSDLLSGERGAALKLRLLSEARAMARLSHPNIVPVYDVGTAGDRLYLAMEYVEGTTLRRWLDARARLRDDVLDVFLDAARGLEAIHTAGLVHRDFKLDNVLVDARGVARVADFGLARPELPAVSDTVDDRVVSPNMGSPTTLSGTLGYVAPEVLRGGEASPAADQFAFCIGLHIALCGRHPFDGDDGEARNRSILTNRRRRYARRVPRWLRRIIDRGLHPDASRRFGSMGEVARALERRPRRWAIPAIGAGVAVLGVAAIPARDAEPPCPADGSGLQGSWDAEVAARTRAAFVRTGAPAADDQWEAVRERLDDYAQRWSGLREDLCRSDNAAARPFLAQQLQCLDDRGAELRALVDGWAEATEDDIAEAARAASRLQPVELCLQTEGRARLERPPLPEARAAYARARAALARGDLEGAKTLAADVAAAALRAGDDALFADARVVTGWAELEGDERRRAHDAFAEAHWVARSVGLDDVAADAAIGASNSLVGTGADDEVERWLEWGEMATRRAGDLPMYRARLQEIPMKMALERGQYDEALRLGLEVHALYGDIGEERWQALTASYIAEALINLDRGEEAIAYYREAYETMALTDGRASGYTGIQLLNLATATQVLGDVDGARPMLEEARDLLTDVFGPDHPAALKARNNIASGLFRRRRFEEAGAMWTDLLTDVERSRGRDSAMAAGLHVALGDTRSALGAHEEAAQSFRRAIEIHEALLGEAHPVTLPALASLTIADLRQSKTDEAMLVADHIVEIIAASPPGPHDRAVFLHNAGLAYGEGGRLDRACPLLREALDLAGTSWSEDQTTGVQTWLADHCPPPADPDRR